jgi:hypothetical protein
MLSSRKLLGTDLAENTASIVDEASLPRRCNAMVARSSIENTALPLLRALVSARIYLLSRCLETDRTTPLFYCLATAVSLALQFLHATNKPHLLCCKNLGHALLCYDTVWSGSWLITFQRKLLPPLQGRNSPWRLFISMITYSLFHIVEFLLLSVFRLSMEASWNTYSKFSSSTSPSLLCWMYLLFFSIS